MKGIPHSTSEQVQSPRRKSGKPATSKAMLLVRALAEDCGVDLRKPIAWLDIAMVLARRHVPGFSVTGTPPHAAGDARHRRNLAIWIAIHWLIDRKGLSIRSAATIVA